MECIAVGQAHSRFRSVIREHGMSPHNTIKIDPTLLYYYPMEDMPWAYEAMGRKATALELKEIYEDDMYYLLALFPKVQNLSLEDMNLKDIDQVHLFPKLKSLSFENVRSETPVLVRLFKHLDESLRKIDFGSDLPKGLDALHNIQDVRLCNRALTKDLTTFWEQNHDIEDIYLGVRDSFHQRRNSEQRMWDLYEKHHNQIDANFEAMAKLKKLTFLSYTIFFSCPDSVKFPFLRQLSLFSDNYDVLNGFLENVGTELLYLTVDWNRAKCYDYLNLYDFPNLKHLDIGEGYHMYREGFCDLPNLQWLAIPEEDWKMAVEAVEWFPALTEINVGNKRKWTVPDELKGKLQKVLRKSGREISINGRE